MLLQFSGNCKHCERPFSSESPRADYCTEECRSKARWLRIKSDPVRLQKALLSSRVCTAERTARRWKLIFEKHGDHCCKCKQTFPRCVYDLHHPDPKTKTSRKEIAGNIIKCGTDEQFYKLLDETLLVCANCHRLIHGNKRYGT